MLAKFFLVACGTGFAAFVIALAAGQQLNRVSGAQDFHGRLLLAVIEDLCKGRSDGICKTD